MTPASSVTNTWVEAGEMPSPRSGLAILSVPMEAIGKEKISSLKKLCIPKDVVETPETASTT